MNRLKTASRTVLVVLFLVSALTPMMGVAAATGGTTTTAPPATNTTAGNNSTNSTNQAASQLLWKLIQKSQTPSKKKTVNIVEQVSPTLWITGYHFNKQDGTVTVTLSSRVSTTVTVTDASGIDPHQATGKTSMRTITIPRGTYTITVPATVASDGNQLITLSDGHGLYWLSNKVVANGHIFVGGARWSYVQFAFIVAAIFTPIGVGVKALFTVRGANRDIVRVF